MKTKRLYRSRNDVMIGGVCSGLAKYFELDPTIIRLAFVLLFLIGSGGFWIYLILWLVTPLEPKEEGTQVVEVQTGSGTTNQKHSKYEVTPPIPEPSSSTSNEVISQEKPVKSREVKPSKEEPKAD